MERRGQSESQQHDEATQQQPRSCEPRRKRMDERSASSEMARIISDPATGRCYCRGRVLGKVAGFFARGICTISSDNAFFQRNLTRFVSLSNTGRFRKVLRDDRPVHQQSLRGQNYPTRARLQAAPAREGKRAQPRPAKVAGCESCLKKYII